MRSFGSKLRRPASALTAIASLVLLATCDLDKITSVKPKDGTGQTTLNFTIAGGSEVILAGATALTVTPTFPGLVQRWKSSAPAIAAVDSLTGSVTGISIGSATITARLLGMELDTGFAKTHAIRVRYKGIRITAPTATDSIPGLGLSRSVIANGLNNANVVQPTALTGVTLVSRDTLTLSVNASNGTLIARKAGSARVVASFDSYSDSVMIRVRPVAKTIAFLTPDYVANSLNANRLIPVTVRDVGDSLIVSPTLSWRVVDTTVATINAATGVLRAKKVDTTRVFVTSDTVTRSIKLRVVQVPAFLTKSGGDAQTDTVGQQLPSALTATVTDSGGAPVAGASVTFRVGVGATSGAVITDSVKTTDANGQASLGSWRLGRTAGTQTVIAATGAVTITFSATAVADAPFKVGFNVQPTSTAIGAAITPAVRAAILDSLNNVTSSTASVTLAFQTNPGGATLGGTLSIAAVAGIATFSDLSISTGGAGYSLRATSSGLVSDTSRSFDAFGAPVQLGFVTHPVGTSATATLAPVRVAVQDANGATVVTATDLITLTIGSGTGTLGGTLNVAAVNGVATFNNLSLGSSGTYTLNAAAPGRTGGTSFGFIIGAVGPAAKLVFAVQPASAVAGTAIAPQIKVQVLDANGAIVTSSSQQISLAIDVNAGGGTISGTVTRNAAGGEASFNDISINRSGTGYKLAASAPGTAISTVVSGAFNLTPGTANKIGFLQGPTHVVSGSTISPAVTVAIQDALNNIVTSAPATPITLALGGTGCTAAVNGLAATNTASGVATFAAISTAATFTNCFLSASATGFTAVGSNTFNAVAATGAVRLKFTTQPASSATAGTSMNTGTVAFQDAAGVNATAPSSVVITLSVLSGPSGFNGGATTQSTATSATFSNTFNVAGTYRLIASSSGYRPDTSAAFVVNAGAASRVGFISQPNTIVAGVPFTNTIQVAVQDQFGNTVATATNSVQLSSNTNTPSFTSLRFNNGTLNISATAVNGIATFSSLSVYTPATSARINATATGTTLFATSSSIFDISAGPTTHLGFKTQPPASVNVNTLLGTIEVTAQDSVGNIMTDYTDPITISIVAGVGSNRLLGTKTVTPSGGIATFTGLSINSAGEGVRLGAAGFALQPGASDAFTVVYPGTTLLANFDVDPWDLTLTGSTLVVALSGRVATVSTSGGTVTTLATLARAALAVASDGVNVYFVSDDSTLRKVPLAGGTVTTLVTGIGAPHPHLEVSGGFVYFANGTQLRRVSATQSPSVDVSATSSLFTVVQQDVSNKRTFAFNGTTLFFATNSGVTSGPAAGGATTLLNADSARTFVLSGSTLYYLTSAGALTSVPTSGGAGTPINSSFAFIVGKLSTDGANVYVSRSSGIARVTIANGTFLGITTTHNIWGMALDGSNVYWARYVPSTNATEIYRAPK